MKTKLLKLVFIGLFLFVAGCETARGLSQDSKNTWNNMKKADDWWKDNMW